jgi:hypothetical protein
MCGLLWRRLEVILVHFVDVFVRARTVRVKRDEASCETAQRIFLFGVLRRAQLACYSFARSEACGRWRYFQLADPSRPLEDLRPAEQNS